MTELAASAPSVDISDVAPALDKYIKTTVIGGVWERTGLAARDRGLVTIAALIARSETITMAFYVRRALNNGVTAAEVSEVITHLAFYCGLPNAISAVEVAREVFAERGIDQDQLPPASPELMPIDEAAEAKRAESVRQNVGPVSESLVAYTGDLLFKDLWLRPGLAPRDRSLITVSALIATGQVAQITFHLNRAMDNGLTREEMSETLTHLAFYCGWPNAMSAVPVIKDVFEKRSEGEKPVVA